MFIFFFFYFVFQSSFMKNNIIWFGICFLIFATLKYLFRCMDVDYIRFLIFPTSIILEIVTGAKAVYEDGAGYFYSDLNIIIDKSCSGFNFLLISFLMTAFIFLRQTFTKKWIVIPLSFAIAYLITIIANVSRITGYLAIMRGSLPQLLDANDSWLHQAEGVFVYLFFLILLYFILNHITNIRNSNEETAQS